MLQRRQHLALAMKSAMGILADLVAGCVGNLRKLDRNSLPHFAVGPVRLIDETHAARSKQPAKLERTDTLNRRANSLA
jgi:hypothetical protein